MVHPLFLPVTWVTLGSLMLGTAGLFALIDGHPVSEVAWLVVFAGILDALDGTLARAFDQTTETGAALDSLTDLLSFGVLPAALLHEAGQGHILTTAGAAVYVAATALRLARFDVIGRALPGIPCTMTGGTITVALLALPALPPEAWGVVAFLAAALEHAPLQPRRWSDLKGNVDAQRVAGLALVPIALAGWRWGLAAALTSTGLIYLLDAARRSRSDDPFMLHSPSSSEAPVAALGGEGGPGEEP